ncbi:ATP binding protein [Haematococcus lacustris]|uniref:ATP binding protein n=1 Tax=Haematococcus lacustris TaxID=44745 RepID=A0A699Y9X5_HAELA|nr:ATP binding protein [Haematococcus lacustris]
MAAANAQPQVDRDWSLATAALRDAVKSSEWVVRRIEKAMCMLHCDLAAEVDLLGQGGNGEVHRGLIGSKAVAVKVQYLSSDEGALRKEAMELSLMYVLGSSHPGFLRPLGHVVAPLTSDAALAPCAPLPRTHLLAIVQPLASGDARQYIRKQGPLPSHLICHVMQQVCSALAHMHALQLCHGDLKLDNVLLGPSLQAWLADLGSAFFLGTHTSTDYLQLPHHVCTEPYRAPEVVDSRRYSAASDVWAVGLMLAELAQGRLCYVTKPSAHPTTVSQGDVGSRVLPAPQPLPQRYVSREDLAQGLSWDQTQQQLTASDCN